MTVLAVLALLVWVYLIAGRGGYWRDGERLAPARPPLAVPLAVVVPARDEAEVVARSIGSLLAQDYPGAFRVVLVDDGSADATVAIARGLPGAERLTVLAATPRPEGWTGKLWAVSQGVAATEEELLLLTDADIVHDPAHLASLVAQAERGGFDLVSEMVALNCDSPAERALVPAFVYLFAALYPFAWVSDPLRTTAAAAGGTMLIRRAALRRIGGIAAIRAALIDDVALARAVKRDGRIWLGHSLLARSVRRYPGFADIWRMVARSAYAQLRYSPLWLELTTLSLVLVFLVPVLAALFGHGVARACGLCAWAIMAASFLPTLARYRLAPLWAVALPAIVAFYGAATLDSAVDHHLGRGVEWKRRTYAGPAP
jgi:hopene-associated glycosyltransferase HpnB